MVIFLLLAIAVPNYSEMGYFWIPNRFIFPIEAFSRMCGPHFLREDSFLGGVEAFVGWDECGNKQFQGESICKVRFY